MEDCSENDGKQLKESDTVTENVTFAIPEVVNENISAAETELRKKYSSRLRSRNAVSKDENLGKSVTQNQDKMDLLNGGSLLAVVPTFHEEQVSMTKGRKNDPYCWVCHKEKVNMECVVCPRSYHSRCIHKSISSQPLVANSSQNDWVCLECRRIMADENLDNNISNQPKLNLEQLCLLLQFVIHRLKHSGIEPFLKPVSNTLFPAYKDYIIHPMDIFTVECNIKKRMYGCTYSFLMDLRWIHHNCIIFNGYHHKLSGQAKNLVKLCKAELSEMETCPSCYLNSYTKNDNAFTIPCDESHTLIWAKMKGFPYWPAKAMKIIDNNVDARFFGAHDRAWVPVNQCYLYSKEVPMPPKVKRKAFDEAVEEIENYIEMMRKHNSSFRYAPSKVQLKPEDVHIPDKFKLDVAWFDKQHLKKDLDCYKSIANPAMNNVQFHYDCGDDLVCDTSNVPNNFSSTNHIASSPSMSPASDMSSSAQALSVNTSYSSKSESDSVTFGGSISPETPSKDVPLGIFELSPNMKATMPRKLDVRVPKIDLNRGSKSNDYKQKLELAMEKIIDGSNATQNESTEAPSVVTDPKPSTSSFSSSELLLNSRAQSGVSLPEFPVTSSNNNILVSSTQKQSSPYVQNLGRTIENCKAMLGIQVCDEVALVESESDDEFGSSPPDVAASKSPIVFESAEDRGNAIAASSSNVTLGRKANDEDGDLLNSEHHPKRMKLSKLCTDESLESSVNANIALNNSSQHLNQIQSNESFNIISSLQDKSSSKVIDLMKGTMEELCKEMGGVNASYQNATINALRMEIEMLNLRHQQELAEMSHNSRLVLLEMRTSLEVDKKRTIALMTESSERKLQESITETKKHQWCSNCGKQAMFYCCWNTSYCDFRCQHEHWWKHRSHCTQSTSIAAGARQMAHPNFSTISFNAEPELKIIDNNSSKEKDDKFINTKLDANLHQNFIQMSSATKFNNQKELGHLMLATSASQALSQFPVPSNIFTANCAALPCLPSVYSSVMKLDASDSSSKVTKSF